MRRNPIPPLIFILAIVALVAAYAFFNRSIVPRYVASRHVLEQRTDIRMSLRVRHDAGPLEEEEYTMSDLDGVSASSYRVTGRNGTRITIAERPRSTLDADTNVAYLFQRAEQDGLWQLTNRPPRGDTSTRYTVRAEQFINGEHGSREYTFTDPRYWATTGGHQFHITLAKDKPVPNLLNLTSTVLVEPRYAQLVADFTEFGPPTFRAKAAQARVRLGARS